MKFYGRKFEMDEANGSFIAVKPSASKSNNRPKFGIDSAVYKNINS